MYNLFEIYAVAAVLLIVGSLFCLVGHFVGKYVESCTRHSVNLNPRKMAEYNQTVDRR